MTTDIEAKEVTIGKLFSPDFMFEIPIYQRPLSWESDNFDQLFEDIFDAMNGNQSQYFLGSIVLQKDEKEKNKNYLVDGQQRICALAILMGVIRDFTNNEKLRRSLSSCLYQEEDEFKGFPSDMRIVPWEDLRDVFKEYVYRTGGTDQFMKDFEQKIRPKDTQDPRYHLYEAISIFREKLEERLQEAGQLEKFATYLLKQVYLVYIRTGTITSAFRLFNVLNTRGLPLNTSDLLKSENIGVIKNESIRSNYARIWRDIENNIGRKALEDVIAFIRTIQLKEKARLGIYEEYRKMIFEKEVLKKGREFIDYLKEICDIYANKILEPETLQSHREQNEYRNIVVLLRKYVPFSDWEPPLIAFYHRFKKDEHLLDFVKKLEKKIITEWMAGFSFTERVTSLNRIIKLIETENEPEAVVDKLLSYKGGEYPRQRRTRMLDFSDKERIESIVMDRLDNNQFYSLHGGRLARYVLLRIDMKYWDLENFPGYPGAVTIEHVLPQTPAENSEWVSTFTEKERMEWTNRLGNLVLLSGRKNSKAQNYDFDKKKAVYFKERSTPFRITHWVEQQNKWTPVELKERNQKLINDIKQLLLDY